MAAADSASHENAGFHEALKWAYTNMDLEGDESCVAYWAARGEAWRCAFAEYTLPFVETPTFLVNSKFDSWSLLASGEAGWEATTGGIYTEQDPGAINSEWGAWFEQRLRGGLEAQPGHAAFVTACGYHCSVWEGVKVAGLTPAAAFGLWYTGGAQALPSRLLDDGALFASFLHCPKSQFPTRLCVPQGGPSRASTAASPLCVTLAPPPTHACASCQSPCQRWPRRGHPRPRTSSGPDSTR
jgi:hypothetical protein